MAAIGEATQDKIKKGAEVIDELQNYFFFDTNGNYLKFDVECDGTKMGIKNLLDDITDGKTDISFSAADFAPYHIFLFHETSKKEMCNIFYSFLQGCFHKKAQTKPYDVLRYENYLKGIEFLKMALEAQYLERSCFTFNPSGEGAEYRAAYALMELKEAADEYFKEFQDTANRYNTSTKIASIKENFKSRILRLAEIYQLPLSSTEKKDKVLAGKIIKHLGIKETETDD